MPDFTKKALEASLKHLLLNKPVNKITISDITEDCGVSRMTFYYHFKDIYDLVEWSCREDALRAMEGNRTYDTWEQGFLKILNAVRDNKPFILNVYRNVSREQIEEYLYTVTYRLLIDVVEERAADLRVRDEDKRFLADFYKYAFVGVMLDWIRDMREDPQSVAGRVAAITEGGFTAALCRLTNGPV